MDLFRQIDSFLTDCEEYVELRVFNGKFIKDLEYLSRVGKEKTKAKVDTTTKAVQSSEQYNATTGWLQKIAHLFLQFQIIYDLVFLIGGGLRLCIKYFARYLIVLIIGLGSTNILISQFKDAPISFLINVLPLVFANHLVLYLFFLFAEKKDDADNAAPTKAAGNKTPAKNSVAKVSPAEVFKHLLATIPGTLFIYLLQIATALTAAVFFFGFSFVLSNIFEYYNIDWSNSFVYWYLVLMIGLIIAVILYIAEVILSFTYPFITLDKKSVKESLSYSYNFIKNNSRYSIVFYTLFLGINSVLIFNLSKQYYEGGFFLGMFILMQGFLFLGVLIKKKYFTKEASTKRSLTKNTYYVLIISLVVGIFSYIAISTLTIRVHPNILAFLEAQRPSIEVVNEFVTYTNDKAGYSIDYPKSWSVYAWSNSAITIYTNTTGTEAGGIKVNIESRPAANSNYYYLFEASPGLVIYDTGTKNVTTKIANVVIKGKNAVMYTYTKTDEKGTEFQTHYLMRVEDKLYDISFVTMNKKLESTFREIFYAMLESFQVKAPAQTKEK